MRKSNRRFHAGWALIIALVFAASARGKDHFLTIGGGSSAQNNQVSLEKNVLYLQRFLQAAGLAGMPHEILFSDGNGGARDLQFEDPKFDAPAVNQLLAEIFNLQSGLTTQYRPHAIPHLWGPSGRVSIARWFDTVGAKLDDGDRLIIYFSGHGGRGKGEPPTNQTLAMWNEPGMTVKEFTALLEKLPPRVNVVLIMVQCFGGGFADVLYTDADPVKGLSPRNRCGFFATLPTRVAAGCTPDVDEENYREYSTSFWAALYGQARTGEKVSCPDYDGDGHTCLAEAHAYTVIHSDTIDIPMKTSDAFLRRFSKSKSQSAADLLASDANFDALLAAAAPVDRIVLSDLSAALHLTGPDRVASARVKALGVARRRKELEAMKQKLSDAHDKLRGSLQARVKSRWPELGNLLHPDLSKMLATQGDQIVKFIEASPRYAEFKKQDDDYDADDKESSDLERTWVKYQRFIRTAESAALAANLPKVAKPEIQERYTSLLKAEAGCLSADK